jgi:hypothetical protein
LSKTSDVAESKTLASTTFPMHLSTETNTTEVRGRYQVAGRPRRVGGVRQQAVEAAEGGASPSPRDTVWSGASEVRTSERLRDGRPVGSVEPPQ